jgi:hypothetical protein
MSTTLSLRPRTTTSRRPQIVASASALVAAASVAVTLAVAGGDDGRTAVSQPSAQPGAATPDRATQYRNETTTRTLPARQAGVSDADRFHHFR